MLPNMRIKMSIVNSGAGQNRAAPMRNRYPETSRTSENKKALLNRKSTSKDLYKNKLKIQNISRPILVEE